MRRGLFVVALLLALTSTVGVGTASADPPSNTTAPAISGTAQSGQTLTASPGSWSGDTSGGFGYQWQRCDTDGANCNPISGAASSTYTAQDSDIGATISVEVTALDGPTAAASPATAVVRSPAPWGGSCQLSPSLGEADSTVFTVSCQGWADYFQMTPITYTYQWWACDDNGVNCSLEHADTPTNIAAGSGMLSGFFDGPGASIDRVMVTICEHDGSCTSVGYAMYVEDDGRPHNNPASPPTIDGHAWLGETLSADPGAWSANPAGYSYQWMSCPYVPGYEYWQRHGAVDYEGCTPIGGATGVTYAVQPSDFGFALLVEVTATNDQGQTAVDSPTTGLVVHAPPTNTALPTVTPGGHPLNGDTLTAGPGSWSGDTSGGFGYQWQLCDTGGANCNPISGATSSTYTVQDSDVGSTIVIERTATNGDGLSTDAISLPTATVELFTSAPVNTVQPQIDTAAPLVGTQVSTDTGSWTGAPVPADGDFSFEWYRCGDGCTLIGGATDQTYTPIEDDFGYQLAVVVSADTDGGNASSNLNFANLTDPVAHADVSISIDSGPDDATDSTSATFTFSSNDDPDVDFECWLDEQDMGPCSSPVAYNDLTEGDHSFSVHGTDFLGLESGVNQTDPVREWTVDTVAPVVTVDSAPSGSTSATVASFSFHADDPNASFGCKLDAGSWTACASPRSYSGLAPGGHTFRVRATDAAENVSAPVTATWAVLAAPRNNPTPEPTPTPTPKPTLKVIPTPAKVTSTPRSTRPGALPPVTAPEFSTSPTVQLVIAPPAGATQIVISNQPDFTGARSFPVSADGLYTWTVLSGGAPNGERTVYVRFIPQGDGGTLASNVKLDDKAPVISKPRYVDEAKAKGGTAGRSRVYLNVPATDPASHLRYIQFAPNRKHPWSWTTYTQKSSIRTKHHFIWVRAADAAGNVSGWQKIIFPKTPIKHPRG